MAHRGRLNVLAHIVNLPYETIFAEFEGGRHVEETLTPEGGTGDVKYHHGAEGTYRTAFGKTVTVTLSPNPSHLEAVNPVVEGRARAEQTSRRGPDAHHDGTVALPVLIHGDAAFPGQGGVAETFNLARLQGYTHRRHDPPDRQQSDRLHHRPARRRAPPTTRAISPRASTRRSSTSTPTIPRRAWRRCGSP